MATIFAAPKLDTEVTIRQAELRSIVSLRSRIEKLKAQLDERESEVAGLIKAGATVEAGRYTAEVKVSDRRSVAWRDIVERELGAGYASNVLSHTKPSPSEKLVVK